MKVLIGYDGSESAVAALEELKRAGLPDKTKVLVVTVSELLMPSLDITALPSAAKSSRRVTTTLAQLQNQAAQTLNRAKKVSDKAAAKIKSNFPDWDVETEIMSGEPASALLEKSQDWAADLIIVGSQNRSAIGRFLIGSISRAVVTDANCSVRVARPAEIPVSEDAPQRTVAGIDDSDRCGAIVEAIAARNWSKESVAMLVTAISAIERNGVQPIKQLIDAQEIQQSAKEKLLGTGLKVLTRIKEGDPKSVLLAERFRQNGSQQVKRRNQRD
ncbi:MAG TPA: universal stress protein [Pyrinomonadaceae bacterium]|jgi:nucleotide-binding universal stress UspA family protein